MLEDAQIRFILTASGSEAAIPKRSLTGAVIHHTIHDDRRFIMHSSNIHSMLSMGIAVNYHPSNTCVHCYRIYHAHLKSLR